MFCVTDHLQKFLAYQEQLLQSVSKFDDVIGLVFLGSAAETTRVDQFSDQDFFLVVKNGAGENFRQDLRWLPNHLAIAFSPRETAHGLKVVYQDGDLLEFAVFEDSELELASANDYRVVLDRQDISARMKQIALRSLPKPFDFEANFELCLSLLLIAVGRARRGEQIAATQHINYALNHALMLIRAAIPVKNQASDSLNSFRRFEFDYPELGAKLNAILGLEPELAGRKLFDLLLDTLPLSEKQLFQASVISKRFDWV